MADNFNFELVSPERLLLSEMVTEVVIPATEGEMTVMAHHAPTMTTIKPGIVSVRSSGGSKQDYVVFGGFADILPTGCTLLAESAVAVEDLSKDELTRRIEAAKKELEDALHHEHKSKLEHFIMELTHLRGIVQQD
ncbi:MULTISPECIES: F0F1 ATP synthase subunit epsilon [Rhizobium]|jgi:F-type H+-transporting ATPase subunit epsilon|uniref:ATP synthase epsilon chain n=2 Tax=Rhizobium mongolense TaxID=57676 RepID=A0ABR6IST5_9HYPH|nr:MULTISPECIES: F0F1 ATP synthase subunit epsilon [Rhizobium]MBB4230963.1 F-type H+-transporting ATPase subunit epsilon [Rhizobium mongolense]OWK24836.1 ATP synthase F0F1 subunit epsilon [Rhizobium yanglingense]TVZ66121.1 F-type H+-transporting ATPase subunit epsilon [Rhizobium mongolense USDA 1844]ULJ71777.1 F0F1 ATP synthase subunit epsilon [Rhizobium gallicum]